MTEAQQEGHLQVAASLGIWTPLQQTLCMCASAVSLLTADTRGHEINGVALAQLE